MKVCITHILDDLSSQQLTPPNLCADSLDRGVVSVYLCRNISDQLDTSIESVDRSPSFSCGIRVYSS